MTRVLLVDDAASVRALLARPLAHSGAFEIVGEAASGDEAVRLAGVLRPDVVVLDLAMPGVDGLTALPEIARLAPGATIIVFSEAIGDEQAALERGAHAVVHKSDSLDHLLGILRRSGPAASGPPTTEGAGAPGRRPFGSPLADAFKEPESELRRLIVDTMSEGLVAVDHEGRMIDANPAALRILGRTEAEVLGQPVARHVGLPFDADGKRLAPIETPLARALRTGAAVRDFVIGVETPDRGLRWLLVNAIPLSRDESPIVGVVVTFTDVTEQRRALEQAQGSERALRASEERFRAAVQTMPDGLVVYSAIRDEVGQIVDFRCEFANRAAGEHQGRPVAEWIGKTFLEHSNNPEAHDYLKQYAAVVETGQPLVLEVPRYTAGGGQVDGAYESHVVKLQDGFLASFRNVTARKRTEQELRTSERRLFSFLSGLPVGVVVIDLAEGPMFLNPRGRELLGRDLTRGGTAKELIDAAQMFRVRLRRDVPTRGHALLPRDRQPVDLHR